MRDKIKRREREGRERRRGGGICVSLTRGASISKLAAEPAKMDYSIKIIAK